MTGRVQSERERGDVVMALLIIIILLAAGGLGYWLWHKHHKPMVSTAVGICTQMSLSQGSSSGAAGTIYKHAVVTNTGSVSCTLTGYPAVFMLDGGGTQVGSGAAANALYPVATITVAPGAKAHTVVAYPQQANFNPGVCSSIGSTMKLYLPGVVTALTTTWSDYSCPGFSATSFQSGA